MRTVEVSGVLSEASCCRCGAPLIKKKRPTLFSRPPYLCLGALPLLYPAAPPSVFDYLIVKYTAPAVALVREYVVVFWVVMVWAFS